jgi:hypothetical protein
LYDARTDYYRQAHVRVEAAHLSAPEVVERILDAVRQLPPLLNPERPDA